MRDKNWNQSFDHIETRYGRIITGLGITLKLELSLLHCYEVVQLELVGSRFKPQNAWPGFGTQSYYEAFDDFRVEIVQRR